MKNILKIRPTNVWTQNGRPQCWPEKGLRASLSSVRRPSAGQVSCSERRQDDHSSRTLRLQGADLYQSVRVSSVFPPHHRVLAEGQHFVVQLLGRVQLFVTPWTAAYQGPPSSTISSSFLKFISIESVMLSSISTSAAPFPFCPQSFPASGSFPMSALHIRCQRIRASASPLPVNSQG